MNIPKYFKISLTPLASINNISIFPYFDNWMRSTCHCSGHVFWRRRINQGPSSIRRHAAIGQRTRRTHTLDTAAVSTQLVLPHGETWYLENVGSLSNMVCLMMAPENCIGGWLSPAAILTGHNQTLAADLEWNGSSYLGLDICCIDIHYLDTYSEWFRSYMTARHCLHPSTSWSWYFRVFTVLQQTCKHCKLVSDDVRNGEYSIF